MNHNNKTLLCLQINLQHCKVASLNLSQVLVELDVDITNKFNNELLIPNIQSNYTVHHNLNKEHAFGAIILVKKFGVTVRDGAALVQKYYRYCIVLCS